MFILNFNTSILFVHGNGQIGRLVMNLIFLKNSYPILVLPKMLSNMKHTMDLLSNQQVRNMKQTRVVACRINNNHENDDPPGVVDLNWQQMAASPTTYLQTWYSQSACMYKKMHDINLINMRRLRYLVLCVNKS